MKIKNVKNVKNVDKIKKNVCNTRWIKNVADICHESNYYLCYYLRLSKSQICMTSVIFSK